MVLRSLLTHLALPVLAASAQAQLFTAEFDGLSEGAIGTSHVEGSITFSNLDQFLGGSTGTFVAEDASTTLVGYPNFTSPMALGFGGYSPGTGAAFSRCGSFDIAAPVVLDEASVNLYVSGGSSSGNTITLEARLGGALVGQDAAVIPVAFGPHHIELGIQNQSYDELRIVGAGAGNSGAFFGLVDSVVLGSLAPGTAFCFGDASGTICPCGNGGGPGEGCLNSTGAGARLSASNGATSLEFTGTQLPSQVPALLFRGSQDVNGGVGALFGDGLRCAGGQIQRLGLQITSGTGTVSWPTSEPLSGSGGVTRYYQGWFRDVSPLAPCGQGFNLTHGLAVTFAP